MMIVGGVVGHIGGREGTSHTYRKPRSLNLPTSGLLAVNPGSSIKAARKCERLLGRPVRIRPRDLQPCVLLVSVHKSEPITSRVLRERSELRRVRVSPYTNELLR